MEGKPTPPYHPQTLRNTLAFLDRVETRGLAEGRELVRCAELIEAFISGAYLVSEAAPSHGGDGSEER